MSSELEELYREVILDHSRRPRRRGLRGDSPAVSRQVNPLCGDEVTMELRFSGAGQIEGAYWTGAGCAISQASASLLAELASGVDVETLRARIAAFRALLRSRGEITADADSVGDAVALAGVARYPARVKCAMLAWVAAEGALAAAGR